MVTGPTRSAPAVSQRLDYREAPDAGESLSDLLRRELWRLLDGRSTYELALTALAQFWSSLEPFLEQLRATPQGRQADESLRLSHQQLAELLEGWPAQPDPAALKVAMAALDQSLSLVYRCRKS